MVVGRLVAAGDGPGIRTALGKRKIVPVQRRLKDVDIDLGRTDGHGRQPAGPVGGNECGISWWWSGEPAG
jgi:hypothetical protein